MHVREKFAQRNYIAAQIYYQGQIAGSAALIIHDVYSGYGEVGYWLGAEFTGKGLATLAAKAMINFAFNTLKLHKLVIRVIVGNDKSIAIAKRLGFTFEGIQVHQRILRGEYYDYNVHYMLHENWHDDTALDFAFRIDEHLELRPFMMHHAQATFDLVDSHRKTLRQWMDWVDNHESIKDTRRFIKTALNHYGDYNGLDAGIWYDGKICGQVSFNSWSLNNFKGDLGYWLADSFTGKGIMTKAVAAMVNYAFDVVGLHRIELLCAIQNERSCAIAKRLNFTHEGILRRGERIRNHYYDVNAYAVLKPEWKA
jgi:ribosomal-protein-serine acetyltransferase